MKRSGVLVLAILLMAAFTLFAGGAKETPGAAGKTQAAPAGKYKEAPMLAALVSQGKLPPVDKRLPDQPKVVKPLDAVGEYGGTWHRVYTGAGDLMNLYEIEYESLFRWNRENPAEVEPNVAESYQLQDGGKTLLVKLRKGMKWSDGEPFTADDIMFWYNDVLLNEKITPYSHSVSWMVVGNDELVTIKKVDDYTVTFNSPVPYPMLVKWLACMWIQPFLPMHYMRQFHPKYTDPAKLDKMAKDAGFDSWDKLFADKGGGWWRYGANLDVPNLNAWVVTVLPGPGRWVVQRNPYYWKVDTVGNQLPYIDKIAFDLVENVDVVNLRGVAGQVDMMFRYMDPKNIPLFEREKSKNNYQTYYWDMPSSIGAVVNVNNKDPVLRKIVQDVRFRRALSLAINRQEVNQIIYGGRGTLRQDAPYKWSEFYSEKWEKDYTQYDPTQANKLLDEMGLDKRDSDGFRLRPDGKTLTFTPEGTIDVSDFGQMLKKYWDAVGIKTAVKINEPSLNAVRQTAGDQDVLIGAVMAGFDVLMDPYYAFPISRNAANFPLWGEWYESKGKGGEEPPQEIKDLLAAYEATKTTVGAERKKVVDQIIDFYAGNCYSIGVVGTLPKPGVVRNNFMNVPKKAVWANSLDSDGYTLPEQFYLKGGKSDLGD